MAIEDTMKPMAMEARANQECTTTHSVLKGREGKG
jgi:hypothetical protein